MFVTKLLTREFANPNIYTKAVSPEKSQTQCHKRLQCKLQRREGFLKMGFFRKKDMRKKSTPRSEWGPPLQFLKSSSEHEVRWGSKGARGP